MNMQKFDLKKIQLTQYLFFTGKGGVGKTSIACATAVHLADGGHQVLLVSTDPASNLQDVFETELDGIGKSIVGAENLTVVNVDPIKAAEQYKENVVAPYRGKLPDVVIKNMEEQLSGSCTVEIAAFNEFTKFLADDAVEKKFDFIIFDTAPTGHTLRMLQLPSAWTNFISENAHGASCLGQLAGLQEKKLIYKEAVDVLRDGQKTTLMLVTRPDTAPMNEAARASNELADIGVKNQILVCNGVLEACDDDVSANFFFKQQNALKNIPKTLEKLPIFFIPLRAYNVLGLKYVRSFLNSDIFEEKENSLSCNEPVGLKNVIEDLYATNKKVIFTMGKGGVGKTTVASAIALGLAERGKDVHLTTTDPAGHLQNVLSNCERVTTSFVDEKAALEKYKTEVLNKARESNMTKEDLEYVEEDLRSPCTQEIAVFKAFANVVEKADNQIVVIDTAPTGHTLLLLDSTQSYHREVKRGQGDIPENVKNLLPRLKDKSQTEVIIVTLAEATPVLEAMRLEDDLVRAEIAVKWWVVNSSFYATKTTNKLLRVKAEKEIEWINKVDKHTDGNFALIKWFSEDIDDEKLHEIGNN